MKPAILTLALIVVPSVAHAAGGIGAAAQKSLGSERTVAKDGLRSSGAPATSRRRISTDRSHCFTVESCHRALAWQKHSRRHLRHLLRIHFRRDASYALRLASVATGASYALMYRVASCESHLYVFAHNPSGSSGLFQWLPSTWAAGPFAAFPIYEPFANALAAGTHIARGDLSPWSSSAGCWR